MDERARAWSIVALSLLCAILAYVLLRTPPKVTPSAAHPQAQQAPSGSEAPQPSGEPEFNPGMYRGWPIFFGWPLPEMPSDGGTGGSEPESGPSVPAPAPLPALPLPEEQ